MALRELMCHMGSHSITCHPAEVTFHQLKAVQVVTIKLLKCKNMDNNIWGFGCLLQY